MKKRALVGRAHIGVLTWLRDLLVPIHAPAGCSAGNLIGACRSRLPVVCVLLLAGIGVHEAGQPLETETARLLPRGAFKVESTFEFQTSPDGQEKSLPLALEYGLLDRLELLVEPVFYTAISPDTGRSATGMGDLEATLTCLFLRESSARPAFAIAMEVKIPTAHDNLIGTGKTDYTPFIIASKQLGRFDTHVNLGYTFVGQPPGPKLKNTIDYAVAGEYRFNEKWVVVGEVTGNSSSLTGAETSDGNESNVIPEASGGERIALVGARYYVRPEMFFSLGASYDNSRALLLRPGFTFRF